MHQQPDFDRPDVSSSTGASGSGSDAEKETIRAEVSQTCNDLASKIKALEEKVLTPVHKVQDAVQNVQNAVQSSVDSVKGAVHTAKERADSVRNQVSEHPWLAIGAGVVAGMIAGYVSAEAHRPAGASRHRSPGGGGFRAAGNGNGNGASSGNGNGASYGAPADAQDKAGMMSGVKGWFAEEFGKFKGIATGAAIALARDFLKDQAPQFAQNIDQFMNDMTHKLGATPFKERLFDSDKGLAGLSSLFGSSAGQQRRTGV